MCHFLVIEFNSDTAKIYSDAAKFDSDAVKFSSDAKIENFSLFLSIFEKVFNIFTFSNFTTNKNLLEEFFLKM